MYMGGVCVCQIQRLKRVDHWVTTIRRAWWVSRTHNDEDVDGENGDGEDGDGDDDDGGEDSAAADDHDL